ncbi:hypothetical protein ACQ4LE_004575 [Meloidogyne hapla]
MEYGVQTHNKFAFLDEDVSDPVETLTKAEEEKKKTVAIPHKKISKPLVSTKTLVTKEVAKPVVDKKEPVVDKKDGVDPPQKQTVRCGPGERGGGVNNRESSGDQGTKLCENRSQQRRPPNSQGGAGSSRRLLGGDGRAYGRGRGQRSGPRGGGGGFRNNFGGAGSSRRSQVKSAQDEFVLDIDQFPALGATN